MARAAPAQKPEGNVRATPRPADFFAAVRDSSPFATNRITEPSTHDVDVEAIHADKFDRLVALAGQAMRGPSAIGAVLLADAGLGKSHLLSRVYRWSAGDGGPRACYIYLSNILADAERLPRYLLKYVVSRLSEGTRHPLHMTPLFRLVDRAIRHAMAEAGLGEARLEDDLKRGVDAYRAHFETSIEGRTTYEVLFQFWRHARPEKAGEPGRRYLASAAVDWLSGDEIDPDAAARIGARGNGREPAMLRGDPEVQQVFLAMARLALASRMPFVLCIDQVDNIDPDRLTSLARFLQSLLDHAKNLLVITSGVNETLLAAREQNIIPKAAWDRIAQFKVELLKISWADGRKILEARLERFLDPYLGLDPVRRRVHEDTLFPMGRARLESRHGGAREFRPRDVLTWARDAWEGEQARLARLGGEAWIDGWSDAVPRGPVAGATPTPGLGPGQIEAAIDSAVDGKIEEHVAQHRLDPGSLPPDADNLATLVESLLSRCRAENLPYTLASVERLKKKGTKLPPYNLLVRGRRKADGGEITAGLVFITTMGNAATASLRRLLEVDGPPDHRILVTDQERRPLNVGPQGDEYYRGLLRLGPARFEHVKLDLEQYARLDALMAVVGMARSRDLEIEVPNEMPRAVTEAEVIASHHRRDRLRSHPLLRPLLTEDSPPVSTGEDVKTPRLDEDDVMRHVMAQLALTMGSTTRAIANGYVAKKPAPGLTPEGAWPQVKAIAERMHADGLVHATPQDNDLFLLLKK